MDPWRERLEAVLAVLRCTRAEALALAVLTAGAVVAVGVVVWAAQPGEDPDAPAGGQLPPGLAEDGSGDAADAAPATPAPPGTDASGGEPEPEEAVVHVAGEVARPGVVTVPGDARVEEAIAAAGGATRGADLAAVNLARTVEDGELLTVPHVDDEASPPEEAERADDGETAVALNDADAEALEQLPGVGEVTAARIIEHREAHGDFAAVDELLEVPGIGEATLDELRDHVEL